MQAEIVRELYEQYSEAVFRYILGRVCNYTDAEDLRSDVFIKVMANLERYDSRRATYSTWIYAITRNTVNDYFRGRLKTAVGMNEFRMDEEDARPWEECFSALADALRQCTERERDIIILHYYYGYPYARIAEKMQISCANVRMISFRTSRKLRELMRTM
jgi:RNA polymerase sigma-70 factor (ECF subfamily)